MKLKLRRLFVWLKKLTQKTSYSTDSNGKVILSGNFYLIPYSRILYFSTELMKDNEVLAVTTDNAEYVKRATLREILHHNPNTFIRVSKWEAINYLLVKSRLNFDFIFMTDGRKFKVSRHYKKSVRDFFESH